MRTRSLLLSLLLPALLGSASCDGGQVLDEELGGSQDELTGAPPAWMGNYAVKISRESGSACDGAVAPASPVVFDSWARQRAATTNFCFEVWEPGVTDWNNPNLWQELDSRAYYRFGSSASFQFKYVNLADRVGNNARYALNLRDFDPYAQVSCTKAVSKTLQVYFWVNGKKSSTYSVRYDACT